MIKIGDKVRIKNRKDWPKPSGYPLANLKGVIIEMQEEEGFVIVNLETPIDIGANVTLRVEAVESEVI